MGVMTTNFLGKFGEIVFYIAECLCLSWFAKIFGGIVILCHLQLLLV